MADSLKQKTGVALFWSLIDKGGFQVIQMLVLFFLARELTKDEFGTIAVLGIFTAIATILQDSGFTIGLIRKKDVSQEEYSSVFYFNIITSISIYTLFFISAPLLGRFYNNPELINLSRFVFLAFLLNSFGIVQNIHLIRQMNFKTNAIISLTASIISGIIAIWMAYNGYGVWALATQLVLQFAVRNLLLWIFIRWIPSMFFSFSHLKALIPFSMKLTITGIINQLGSNIQPTIIGKYSMGQAGLYSQGTKFNTITQVIIADSIKAAILPMFTHINDDPERRTRAFRKAVRLSSFVGFPITLLLIILAKPIVLTVLTKEFIEAIPILQIAAIGAIFFCINTMNTPILQALGRSGDILKFDTARNIVIILTMFIAIRHGVLALVATMGLVNILFFIIQLTYVGTLINYNFKQIISDIVPYLGIAIGAFAPAILLGHFYNDINIYLLGVIQTLLSAVLYLVISKLAGSTVLEDCINLVKHLLKLK